MVGNGTEMGRLPMSSNAGYHLAIKTDLSGLEWVSPTTGAGEINIGSNVGTAGVGPYLSKSGVTLRFKKINAAPNGRIVVTDDVPNNEIDLAIQGGTEGQFLKTVGGVPTWSSLTSQYGTVMPDNTNFGGPRYGRFMGGAMNGDGQLAGLETHGTLTTNCGAELTTVFTSDAEDDAVAGWVTRNTITSRQYNPHFKTRYRQVINTEKSWVGYIDNDEPITGSDGDNPLIDHSGFMYGFAETDPNFLIRWNNGGPTPQTFNTGVPKDVTYRAIEFFLDETVDQIKLYINGVLIVNSGTQVPAATQGLNLQFLCESAGGTATPLRMDYAYITHTPA